jgi:Ca-activated chloride channel family protein
VDVHRSGSNAATVGYEQKDVRPDTDFRLVFAQDARPLDLRLLSSAKAGEDGYFLLMVSPGMQAEGKQVQTRDVCFVVDTSGSMAGAKIEQAKRALRYCVNSLNAGDRFQVVRFSTGAEPLWEQLTAVSPESTRKAMEFIDSFKALGGTDIQDALGKAMKIRTARQDSSRPYVVVFLTDGQPTIGETNEDKLVAAAGGSEQTRIFSFGIGEDINTHLLDRLAEKTGAFSTYVGSRENLEVKVSNFFAGIQAPVLTDVQIALTGDGVRAYDLMPRTMPDLYRGQTLYVVGRYHGSGPAAVSLSGSLNGEAKRFSQDVKLASDDNSRPYVAQLYATRRVGWLLDEIRLHGESAELRDEVTRLAREFGIVTPYTSYLIVEDERRRNVPAESQTMRELSLDKGAISKAEYFYSSSRRDSARLERSGAQAVTNSQSVNAMKEANAPAMGGGSGMMGAVAMPSAAADALAKPATSPTLGYRNATNYAQQVRVVSGRAFYQNGNTWTDATAQSQQNLRQQTVKFGSDAYFALANRSKSVATWLALGNEVDVVVDGTLYQVRN